MKSWFLSLFWLSVLFPSTSEAKAQTTSVESVPLSELTFQLSSGYLIQVDGSIGTQSKLKFILDTGATITIVDRKIVDKLKLDRGPAES